jgi:hypothetical protein
MVAQPYKTLMSVEDYLALDRASNNARYEYIVSGPSWDRTSDQLVMSKLL